MTCGQMKVTLDSSKAGTMTEIQVGDKVESEGRIGEVKSVGKLEARVYFPHSRPYLILIDKRLLKGVEND